ERPCQVVFARRLRSAQSSVSEANRTAQKNGGAFPSASGSAAPRPLPLERPPQLHVHALVLEAPLAAAMYRLQGIAPVDLVVETGKDSDEGSDAHTLQRLAPALDERAAIVVVSVADVVERSERQRGVPFADPRLRQRDAQLDPSHHAVV